MLLRRFGTTMHSVTPDFDSRAITEISFRRDGAFSISVEEFEEAYEKVDEEEVSGTTEGPVQSEAEGALLEQLEERISELLDELEGEEVLLFLNETGVDYPKMRDRKEGVIVEGENRFRFHWRVEPPLRIGRFRPRSG